jgi:hypothetical protein
VASPEPIGFLQEAVRWWDHWLKGVDNGVMEEPMLRAWMPGPGRPGPARGGRWVAEQTWPSGNVERRAWELDFDGRSILADQGTGLDAGRWISGTQPEDYPPDQRSEDGRSLCWDSAPLAESTEVLGYPVVTLEISADRPVALVAARLCEVAPNGVSHLVARGMLNLTHRDSHEHPEPLVPGEHYTVRLELDAAAHEFAAGNRLRVALSPAYWPWVWPSPEQVTLTIHDGRLELPVRGRQADDGENPFEPAEGAEPLEVEIEPRRGHAVIERDLATGRSTYVSRRGYPSLLRFAKSGLEYGDSAVDTYVVVGDDPLSAEVVCERTVVIARDGWRTRTETRSRMTSSLDSFFLVNTVEAYEGTAQVFAKTWSATIPRDLV